MLSATSQNSEQVDVAVVRPCSRVTSHTLTVTSQNSGQVDDHVAFVKSIALQYEGQGVPLFLAGNSLGGLITLHTAAQMPGMIAGLVLQGRSLTWSGT